MDFYRALASTMDPLARRVDRDAPEGSEEEHALGQGHGQVLEGGRTQGLLVPRWAFLVVRLTTSDML